MNERIYTLAEQAGFSFKYKTAPDEMNPGHKLKDLEKFAQLIVRRTLDIVEAHTEIFQSSEAQAMVEHIKQSVKTDFGVEQ